MDVRNTRVRNNRPRRSAIWTAITAVVVGGTIAALAAPYAARSQDMSPAAQKALKTILQSVRPEGDALIGPVGEHGETPSETFGDLLLQQTSGLSAAERLAVIEAVGKQVTGIQSPRRADYAISQVYAQKLGQMLPELQAEAAEETHADAPVIASHAQTVAKLLQGPQGSLADLMSAITKPTRDDELPLTLNEKLAILDAAKSSASGDAQRDQIAAAQATLRTQAAIQARLAELANAPMQPKADYAIAEIQAMATTSGVSPEIFQAALEGAREWLSVQQSSALQNPELQGAITGAVVEHGLASGAKTIMGTPASVVAANTQGLLESARANDPNTDRSNRLTYAEFYTSGSQNSVEDRRAIERNNIQYAFNQDQISARLKTFNDGLSNSPPESIAELEARVEAATMGQSDAVGAGLRTLLLAEVDDAKALQKNIVDKAKAAETAAQQKGLSGKALTDYVQAAVNELASSSLFGPAALKSASQDKSLSATIMTALNGAGSTTQIVTGSNNDNAGPNLVNGLGNDGNTSGNSGDTKTAAPYDPCAGVVATYCG